MAWPTVFNEGYRVLRDCFDLYKKEWKDAVAETALLDMSSMPMVEDGIRRIGYMFHRFAEYVWGLLMDLLRYMVALIDPDAALEKLETVIFTLQEFCNRGQGLEMSIGFLSHNLWNAGAVDPKQELYSFAMSQNQVMRHLNEVYEDFMGEQKANSFDLNEEL